MSKDSQIQVSSMRIVPLYVWGALLVHLTVRQARAATQVADDTNVEGASAVTRESSVRGYIRPYLGWGWPVTTAPSGELSWYRFGWGVAGGVNLSGLTLGLDFNYFNGTKIDAELEERPTVKGEGRMNAFRLTADVGYDFRWKRITVRPHLEAGMEWRRLSIGDEYVGYQRFAIGVPALLGLVSIRKDGLFAIGIDTRWNIMLIEGSLYTHLSGFLAFESKF